jgi:hypothetical protein
MACPFKTGDLNFVNINSSDPAQPKIDTAHGCKNDGWCIKELCNGIQCRIDTLPSKVEFGLVTTNCCSQEQAVTVYNNGSSDVTISSFGLTGADAASFVISKSPKTPYLMGAGTSVSVSVKYRPQAKAKSTAALLISNSCDSGVEIPLYGEGTDSSDVTDRFTVPDRAQVDVLWCVDVSRSMEDDQQALADNFPVFMEHLTKYDIDYQIGVVTSEVQYEDRSGSGDPIKPGVLFQRKGHPRIIASNPPSPLTPPYQPTASSPIDSFRANATPGETAASGEMETCLEAVRLALTDPNAGDPAANKGFLRPLARLVVIALSDENDQADNQVDYYVDFLRSIKGARNTHMLSFSVIGEFDSDYDPVNDPAKYPGVYPCSGEDDGATRYLDAWKKLHDATGSGLALSICKGSDWGNQLDSLGWDTVVIPREFMLSRPASEVTITVTVDGAPVVRDLKTGWWYDPTTNSVVISGGFPIGKGSVIEVTYSAQCDAC